MELMLRERTVLISGAFTSMVQNLMVTLTQQGADVAFVDRNTANVARFCNQLNDNREANEKFGRAFAFQADVTKKDEAKDVVGKVASTFGSVDIYIDAQMTNLAAPLPIGEDLGDIDELLDLNLKSPMYLTHAVLGFLKGRKRGRVIYMINEASRRGDSADALTALFRSGLIAFTQAISKVMIEHNVTVNVLALGSTEEFLMGHFKECQSIKEATEKVRATNPTFKLADSNKIANSVVFLCSQSGLAITGQTITVN